MKNNNTPSAPLIIVVMGVSGCGKSTIAESLANLLQTHFKDGDDLHPASNIEKMESGAPLSDADRIPWLVDVSRYGTEQAALHGSCVIACSALKRGYRDILNQAGNVVYVFLDGSYELIASRMRARKDHFMPETLLKSQFEALESPQGEENVVSVGIDKDPDNIAADAVTELKKSGYIVG
ncbi:MAG: gluconokinase [Granulosicoccus sp.]